MRGRNGEEIITGNGRVQKLDEPNLPNGEPPLKIDLRIQAENLPFSDQLRKALQPAWQKTWAIINPTGASDVDATIHIAPGEPDVTHITISPRPESAVRLVVPRRPIPATGAGSGQPGVIELRMENARGRFEFDNGKVAMRDVNFFFHGAPVQFSGGEVRVEDSGRFALAVSDLWIKDIRFDSGLRNIMPPLMAQFAVRLDDGRPFTARGNLRSAGPASPGEPAWCSWARTRAVFVDNSIKTEHPPAAHPGPARGGPRLVRRPGARGPRDHAAGQRQPDGPADHRARVAVPRRARPRPGWTSSMGGCWGASCRATG